MDITERTRRLANAINDTAWTIGTPVCGEVKVFIADIADAMEMDAQHLAGVIPHLNRAGLVNATRRDLVSNLSPAEYATMQRSEVTYQNATFHCVSVIR